MINKPRIRIVPGEFDNVDRERHNLEVSGVPSMSIEMLTIRLESMGVEERINFLIEHYNPRYILIQESILDN